jgi:predicted RNA-binding protein YlqC (UPF0109 family)
VADLREDFVQYVVKSLVTNPDAVSLRRVTDEKGEYLELTVDPSDMGKVIGKAGATAKSIRTLLRGVGAKDDLVPLPLKIVDPEGDVREAPVQAAEAASVAEEQPEAQVAEAPVAEEKDEHKDLHDRTKKEMQEFADFDL